MADNLVYMDALSGQAGIGIFSYAVQGGIHQVSALQGVGAAPTLTLGSAAGTGTTYSFDSGSTNLCGVINITTGTLGLAIGNLFTLTFSGGFSFPNKAIPSFTPANGALASNPFSGVGSANGAACGVGSILSVSTAYKINYQFMGN